MKCQHCGRFMMEMHREGFLLFVCAKCKWAKEISVASARDYFPLNSIGMNRSVTK